MPFTAKGEKLHSRILTKKKGLLAATLKIPDDTPEKMLMLKLPLFLKPKNVLINFKFNSSLSFHPITNMPDNTSNT